MFDILDCDSAMGMEDGNISDSALKASSEVSNLQYKIKTLFLLLKLKNCKQCNTPTYNSILSMLAEHTIYRSTKC